MIFCFEKSIIFYSFLSLYAPSFSVFPTARSVLFFWILDSRWWGVVVGAGSPMKMIWKQKEQAVISSPATCCAPRIHASRDKRTSDSPQIQGDGSDNTTANWQAAQSGQSEKDRGKWYCVYTDSPQTFLRSSSNGLGSTQGSRWQLGNLLQLWNPSPE